MKRVLFSIVLLTLAYTLFLGSFKPWDLAIGAALSAALLLAFRRFLLGGSPAALEGPGLAARLFYFWPFAAATAWGIIVGTWKVSLITLSFRELHHPGIVAVPIGERTPAGVAVAALATTLSPGTFLVDVDWERGVMLLHVIDAGDPEAVRGEQREFYRRYQRRVFP